MAEKMTMMVDDDYVEYYLFPKLSATTKESLEELRDRYLTFLSSHLADYVWQNEPFNLMIVDDIQGNNLPHICGKTKYGENVDDEWFIVFMLIELTKEFPELIVRCIDNDGEFLLIEMAEQLPKWMNPETTENRVFLYHGKVHIIPQPKKSGPLSRISLDTPTNAEAISFLQENASLAKCNDAMQRALFHRLSSFPAKTKENQHYSHCFIPATLAVILKQQPQLLSAAVRAFYVRDSIDLKVCQMMKYFPPETRVLTGVTFTKCLYAQLVQQNYTPNKLVGWNIPPPQSPSFKSYDLGMKLACGFEILVAKMKKNSDKSSSYPHLTDLATDVRWMQYLNSLKDNNYFRSELEGSKLYQELLGKAYQYYCTQLLDNTNSCPNAGKQILKLLESVEVDIEKLKEDELNLLPPDDDDWLNISPEDLDGILTEKFSNTANGDDSNKSANIVEGLKAFVNHSSGVDGVEVPKFREQPMKNNKANRITLDPDAFADAYQSILDFKVPEWEEGSSSEMSDYSDDDLQQEMDLSKPLRKGNRNSASKKMISQMEEYMEQMDRELSATSVGQSFDRLPCQSTNGAAAENDTLDNYSPVNVDLSALRNILESYHTQQGLPGPASNIMSSMGIQLPDKGDN